MFIGRWLSNYALFMLVHYIDGWSLTGHTVLM